MWTEPFFIAPDQKPSQNDAKSCASCSVSWTPAELAQQPRIVAVEVPGSIPHGVPGDSALAALGGLERVGVAFGPARKWFDKHRYSDIGFPASALSLDLEDTLATSRKLTVSTMNEGTGYLIKVRRHKSGRLSYLMEGAVVGRASFVPEGGLVDYHLVAQPKNQEVILPNPKKRMYQRMEDDIGTFSEDTQRMAERLDQGAALMEDGTPQIPPPGEASIGPLDEELIDLRAPQMHTRLTRSFHYGYAGNVYKPRASITIGEMWGVPEGSNDKAEDMLSERHPTKHVVIWRVGDAECPAPLTPEAIQTEQALWDENQKEYYHYVWKQFKDRPIWTRPMLAAHCPPQFSDMSVWKRKPVISALCFLGIDGPFRMTLIRRGYNPTLDPGARFFQTIDFRDKKLQKKQVEEPEKLDSQSMLKQYRFQEPPNKSSRYLQLIDIDHDVVRSLVHDSKINDVCSRDYGWYAKSTMDQIRAALQLAVKQMLLMQKER